MDLSEKIHLLGDILGDIIYAHESPGLFDLVEQIRDLSKRRRSGDIGLTKILLEYMRNLSSGEACGIASAFSLYFDLVNLAEEDERVGALRRTEAERAPAPVPESIEEAVATLKQRGLTNEQMCALLDRLSIELVLTAHPTEARRRTILSKVQRIGGILQRLDGGDLLASEVEMLRQSLQEEISSFWLTERSRSLRPAVADEVRTGLYTIDSIF
jgi:phosphoenolpyruvate carboxylase